MRVSTALLVLAVAPSAAFAQQIQEMTTFQAIANTYPTAPPTTQFCSGPNGEVYAVTHVLAQGPMVSSDSRLDGIFKVDAVLVHAADAQGNDLGGVGWDWGTIVDAQTGAQKARLLAVATDPDPRTGAPIRSFARGILADGSFFWTNATVTLPPPNVQAPIVIEYGVANTGTPDLGKIHRGVYACVLSLGLKPPTVF